MKFKIYSVIAILLLAAGIVFPNGLSLNSIGPKGFGMGGAFVGLANDYTAIYWNPAGLTQMQKNFVGIFATDIIPMGTYKFKFDPAHIDVDAKSKTNHYISPNLMGFYHFSFAENFTFGLGVYIPAGIGSEWNGNDLVALSGSKDVEWMSKIGVINISPALAYKFSDQFSLGIALNIFYGMFDLKRPGGGGMQYDESSNGFGYGVTFGGLYKPNEQLSLGASIRTKTNVKMSGTAKNPAMAGTGATESDFDRDVAWPLWIAGGIAYRPMDKLVITFDVQFSQWSKSENEFTTTYANTHWMAALTPGDNNKFILHWSDATQVRLGASYSVDENLDLRAGIYTDPAPAPIETYNILFPSISYTGIALGAGYKINSFVFDLGVEYLFGKDREVQLLYPSIDKRMAGTHGMDIPAWSLGVGYEF
jgi:long-chain fatty acid transport protein